MNGTDLMTTLQSRSRRPRFFRFLVLVLVVLASLFGWQQMGGKSATAVKYETSEIVQGNLDVSVAASGKLEPTNVVTIGSELSGIVASVAVDINDRVKKGDLLAQLDPSKLNDAITKSQAALASAQASVKQAEATLTQASATLARQQELAKLSNNRLPSKADMDSAIAAKDTALANLASAQANVDQAAAQLNSDKTNLEKASIRSPIDGVVLSRSVDAGQTVAASLSAPTLFEIAEDLTKMELNVDVDEADVGQVAAGQGATFTVDAWPGRTYPATVTRVSYGSTITDNVVTYTTTLSVDNTDLSLRPGMTASATISTQKRENVLLVPNAALRFSPPATEAASSSGSIVNSLMPRMPRSQTRPRNNGNATPTIWILENNTPRQITVNKGATNGALTEVGADELKAGQQVITGSSTAP